MCKPGQADAPPSPALLLWVIQHGPAKLYRIIKACIKQLQQILLPQLWKRLRQIPSPSLAPVWLAARRFVITVVHARVLEFLYELVAAWLHHISWLKQCFDQGRSRQAFAWKAESHSSPQSQTDDSSEDGVRADEAVTQSSQPAACAFTTASASSPAAQQLSDEAGNMLEAADRDMAESGVESGAQTTQQSMLQLDAIQTAEDFKGNGEADVSPKPEVELDATQQLIGPLDADPLAEDSKGSLTTDDGAKPRPEPGVKQQSTQPTQAMVMTESTSSCLEAEDSSKSESAIDATQQCTQLVDTIKVCLSPEQGAASSPVSSSPKDEGPGCESPLPKGAILGPNSPSPKAGVLGLHSPLPKGDASQQKAGSEQRLLTPPRRERLQGNWSTGAAWLQSQATSAAAFSASADVPMTSAPAASPSQTTSPAPTSLGKHRRHASASAFTLPDQDFFSRPLDRGMPQAAPDKAASPLHPQADKLSTSHMAGSMAADDSPAMSARMTGQQSLQKATIAVKGLQTKYGQASSTAQSSSHDFLGIGQEMLSGAADTEPDTEADSSALGSAAAPGRSSFSFDSPVGLREAVSSSRGAYPSISRGSHTSVSGSAHPSSPGQAYARNSGGAHPASLRGAELGSSAGVHPKSPGEAHSSSSGGPHPRGGPRSLGEAHPMSPGGVYASKPLKTHPSRSRENHPSNSADEPSHAGSMSGTRQHGQRKEEEHIAQASQSHMAAREQPRAHPLKQKKCRALQISEESAQAVDVYNLQSPGLVLQDLSLAPDELDSNDSYALALKHRSVTLKAWSPQPSEEEASSSAHTCPAPSDSGPRPVADGQVLEGQGKGLFLGPPAQRWAADATLKESLNRLPSVPEEEEDSVDGPDSSFVSGLPEQTEVQGNCGMVNKSKRRVTFAMSKVQDRPADQENVPS